MSVQGQLKILTARATARGVYVAIDIGQVPRHGLRRGILVHGAEDKAWQVGYMENLSQPGQIGVILHPAGPNTKVSDLPLGQVFL